MKSQFSLAGIAAIAMLFQGCAVTKFFHDNQILPDGDRLKKAAIHASTDLLTLAPAVGAAAILASGTDRAISNWASSKTPIFGSMKNADVTSNYLRDASIAAYTLSLVGDFKYNNTSNSLFMPITGPMIGLSAAGITYLATTEMKSGFGRTRPDGSDNFSFPSGHASTASLFTTMTMENVSRFNWPGPATFAVNSGLELLNMSTGWARVEAKKHYLSDVLAGAAIGHFLGVFVNDLFINPESGIKMDLNLGPESRGWTAGVGLTIPLSIFGQHPKSTAITQAPEIGLDNHAK